MGQNQRQRETIKKKKTKEAGYFIGSENRSMLSIHDDEEERRGEKVQIYSHRSRINFKAIFWSRRD